jgi:hypothetical protein
MTSFSFSFKSFLKILSLYIIIAGLFLQCGGGNDDPAPVVGPVKPCSTCTFVIAGDEHTLTIDGTTLDVQPGDTICLDAVAKYGGAFIFKNINGTDAKPVIITNCGGTVNLKVTDKAWNFKVAASKHFRVTGGDTEGYYGIRMTGSTATGFVVTDLSTDFEVDHLEVYGMGFAGIMAKMDPTCDDASVRPNYVMKNVLLHDNFVHDTEGEGFYIGSTSYGGKDVDGCGTRYPHTIEGIKIYNNHVLRSGYDGIQLSCATKDAAIFDNVIEDYATKNQLTQQTGIEIGDGSVANCYRNLISKGTGDGIACFGIGSNVIHDNMIVNAGQNGIFTDARSATNGDGVKVLHNTIINPGKTGISIYTSALPHNVCVNNIIVNPGFYGQWKNDAFINDKNNPLYLVSGNITTLKIDEVKFANSKKQNFRLQSSSPAIDGGADISSYEINVDFYKVNRKNGSAYDIGASEFTE